MSELLPVLVNQKQKNVDTISSLSFSTYIYIYGPGISVGIVTDYELDSQG